MAKEDAPLTPEDICGTEAGALWIVSNLVSSRLMGVPVRDQKVVEQDILRSFKDQGLEGVQIVYFNAFCALRSIALAKAVADAKQVEAYRRWVKQNPRLYSDD